MARRRAAMGLAGNRHGALSGDPASRRRGAAGVRIEIVVLRRSRELRLQTASSTLDDLAEHGVDLRQEETQAAIDTYNELARRGLGSAGSPQTARWYGLWTIRPRATAATTIRSSSSGTTELNNPCGGSVVQVRHHGWTS